MIYFSNYKIGLEDIGRNNEATNNGATQNKHYFIHKRNSISNRTLQYSNKSVGDIFNNRKYSNRKSKINRQIT